MSNRKKYEQVHGKLEKGVEVHHINPKHSGGGDELENLIAIPKEQHKEEHLKLYKLYGNFRDLCAYHMINYNFTEAHRISASEGGKIGGKKVKETNVGLFRNYDERKLWASMGGSAAQPTLKSKKIGAFYDPSLRFQICSNGGKKGCLVNGFEDSEKQRERGKKGGPKNKGFIWINDGVKSIKYTNTMQQDIPLEKFLKSNANLKLGMFEGDISLREQYTWINDGKANKKYTTSKQMELPLEQFLLLHPQYKIGNIQKKQNFIWMTDGVKNIKLNLDKFIECDFLNFNPTFRRGKTQVK